MLFCYNNKYEVKARDEPGLKTLDIAKKAAKTASDRQASDVLVLDTRKICYFADYFIICTADNRRQIEAINDAIALALKEDSSSPPRHEGSSESGWVILDAGGVLVHIFGKQERQFYDLEKLWELAKTIIHIQ